MRFSSNSIIIKIAGVIRFFIIKTWYFKKFKGKGISLIGRDVNFILKGKKSKMQVGKKLILSGYNQIFSSGILEIGNNVFVNEYSRILAMQHIKIGDNVTIAKFVTILDHDHNYNIVNGKMIMEGYKTSPIKIGNNILIGDKVTVLKGVSIGNNVVIAAHSLVKNDIPDNCIIAGNPAKVIKNL